MERTQGHSRISNPLRELFSILENIISKLASTEWFKGFNIYRYNYALFHTSTQCFWERAGETIDLVQPVSYKSVLVMMITKKKEHFLW